MNKRTTNELNNLKQALINDLKNKPIEYIDLKAYDRSKAYLINKKYYDYDDEGGE